MKKRTLGLSLVFMLLVALMPSFSYANQNIKIIVDGKEIKTDVAPFIKNGRTMVPVRFISEALGIDVTYEKVKKVDPETGEYVPVDQVCFKKDNNSLITIDEEGIDADGLYFNIGIEYGESMVTKQNRTFVPIRFIANALHLDVNWNKVTNTVELKTNNNHDVYPIVFTVAPSIAEATNNYEKSKAKEIQIEYVDGQYLVNNKYLTVTEYYKFIDAKMPEKRDHETYDSEFLFYGNNYLLMNPECTEVFSFSAD